MVGDRGDPPVGVVIIGKVQRTQTRTRDDHVDHLMARIKARRRGARNGFYLVILETLNVHRMTLKRLVPIVPNPSEYPEPYP